MYIIAFPWWTKSMHCSIILRLEILVFSQTQQGLIIQMYKVFMTYLIISIPSFELPLASSLRMIAFACMAAAQFALDSDTSVSEILYSEELAVTESTAMEAHENYGKSVFNQTFLIIWFLEQRRGRASIKDGHVESKISIPITSMVINQLPLLRTNKQIFVTSAPSGWPKSGIDSSALVILPFIIHGSCQESDPVWPILAPRSLHQSQIGLFEGSTLTYTTDCRFSTCSVFDSCRNDLLCKDLWFDIHATIPGGLSRHSINDLTPITVRD